MRAMLPLDQATMMANQINAGMQTEMQYVDGLLAQAVNTTIPGVPNTTAGRSSLCSGGFQRNLRLRRDFRHADSH